MNLYGKYPYFFIYLLLYYGRKFVQSVSERPSPNEEPRKLRIYRNQYKAISTEDYDSGLSEHEIRLISLNLQNTYSTNKVKYQKDNKTNTHTFIAKHPFLFYKVKVYETILWEASNSEYAFKVMVKVNGPEDSFVRIYFDEEDSGSETQSKSVPLPLSISPNSVPVPPIPTNLNVPQPHVRTEPIKPKSQTLHDVLLTLDIANKNSTDQYDYDFDNKTEFDVFTVYSPHLIKEIVEGDEILWTAKEGQYANKVMCKSDPDNPKLKVFFPKVDVQAPNLPFIPGGPKAIIVNDPNRNELSSSPEPTHDKENVRDSVSPDHLVPDFNEFTGHKLSHYASFTNLAHIPSLRPKVDLPGPVPTKPIPQPQHIKSNKPLHQSQVQPPKSVSHPQQVPTPHKIPTPKSFPPSHQFPSNQQINMKPTPIKVTSSAESPHRIPVTTSKPRPHTQDFSTHSSGFESRSDSEAPLSRARKISPPSSPKPYRPPRPPKPIPPSSVQQKSTMSKIIPELIKKVTPSEFLKKNVVHEFDSRDSLPTIERRESPKINRFDSITNFDMKDAKPIFDRREISHRDSKRPSKKHTKIPITLDISIRACSYLFDYTRYNYTGTYTPKPGYSFAKVKKNDKFLFFGGEILIWETNDPKLYSDRVELIGRNRLIIYLNNGSTLLFKKGYHINWVRIDKSLFNKMEWDYELVDLDIDIRRSTQFWEFFYYDRYIHRFKGTYIFKARGKFTFRQVQQRNNIIWRANSDDECAYKVGGYRPLVGMEQLTIFLINGYTRTFVKFNLACGYGGNWFEDTVYNYKREHVRS